MQSLIEFFQRMHDVDFPYVVLRNFENLPQSVQSGKHGDLDLLVYDLMHFNELFPEVKPVYPLPRVQYKANIAGLNIYIDVRHVGDNYYPKEFQINLLETREYNPRGFFTPNAVHFRIALAYHAVHHKNVNTYQKHLGNTGIPGLLASLQKSRVGYVKPDDLTVGSFNQYWRGATSIVTEDREKVTKKQTSWNDFNLIENEYRILKNSRSRHFPRVFKMEDNQIEIEHCGQRLTFDNLPEDWVMQLSGILKDLKAEKIQHRDIKRDNLMIKDGIIKLIDFGWARFEDDEPDNPPSCLGWPTRPVHEFDDAFSMRTIIKQFNYELEDSCVFSA